MRLMQTDFMQIARRPLRFCLFLGLTLALFLPALAADRSRIKAEDYAIDAEIVPKTHRLIARVRVK